MPHVQKTYKEMKKTFLSFNEDTSLRDRAAVYTDWAKNYDQDVAHLEYMSPSLTAELVSKHFAGSRETALVLDAACGTGLAAAELKECGFGRLVGTDGCSAMLEEARRTGLYQELEQLLLVEEPLPERWVGSFDVVVIVGSLSLTHVPVSVLRDLCSASKPGGFIGFTTRGDPVNLEYKAALELELRRMEAEGLWSRVEAREVDDMRRNVTGDEEGHISGAVYLYRREGGPPGARI